MRTKKPGGEKQTSSGWGKKKTMQGIAPEQRRTPKKTTFTKGGHILRTQGGTKRKQSQTKEDVSKNSAKSWTKVEKAGPRRNCSGKSKKTAINQTLYSTERGEGGPQRAVKNINGERGDWRKGKKGPTPRGLGRGNASTSETKKQRGGKKMSRGKQGPTFPRAGWWTGTLARGEWSLAKVTSQERKEK